MSLIEYIFRSFACDVSFEARSLDDLLKDLLMHALITVPYYQRHFDATGLETTGLSTQEILDLFPILHRDDLTASSEQLTSSISASRKTYWNTSGGSTGHKVSFLQDQEYLKKMRWVTYSQKKHWGYQIGDSLCKIWGDESEILGTRQSYKKRLSSFLKNEWIINAFDLNPQTMGGAVQLINQRQPELIVAYVQAAYELAGYIKQLGKIIHSPKAVIVSAGVCYPEMRSLISEVFDCPVVNRYGSREVGNIACEEKGSQDLIVSKAVYLEVKSADSISTNGTGELLVTSLFNQVMPLVRYAIGDYATLETDENGKQKLSNLYGRTVDMFKTESGALVDGEYFTHLLYKIPGVQKFHILQESYDQIIFQIQAMEKEIVDYEGDISRHVKKVMGSNCKSTFSYVSNIEKPAGGKYRYTVSRV